MQRFIATALFILCLLQAPAALAYSVAFTDEVITWPGYANDWKYNHTDTVGTPHITGGEFIYKGSKLVGINLNYTDTDEVLIPGDWFFDFDQDNYWDYVLHNVPTIETRTETVWTCWGPYEKEVRTKVDNYSLYEVKLGYGPGADGKGPMDGYVESFWPWGYDGRDDHPVQAEVSGDPLQDVVFSGWERDWWKVSEYQPGTAGWSDFILDLNQDGDDLFTYAFAMTCGNDVLYGESTVPAPEPSTFLLLGLGGLGVFFYGRKRKRSS